jgi:uncharacterized protein
VVCPAGSSGRIPRGGVTRYDAGFILRHVQRSAEFQINRGQAIGMRLSREKIIRLSHQITEVLVSSDDVEFVEDRDTIRQQVVQILTATLRDEEKADAEVRKRITSQKKEILEGSEEWDVLYRKYYADELRRMGIAAAPDDRRPSTAYRY